MNKPKLPESKTFCILPWVHLSTRPDGSMRVCCTANASSVGPTNDKEHGGQVGILKDDEGKPSNLNVADFQTAWNSSYMRNVRKQMLTGEQPPSCIKCYKEEAAGHRSKRQWETEYWSKRVNVEKLVENTENDGSVPPQLAYIDLRFGTKCQLACVMCSPHDSSGWIKDWQAINPKVENTTLKQTMQWSNKGSTNGSSYNWHKQNPVFWDQFYEQIPNMQQLYFAGGEALIIDEHYDILRQCIKSGHAKNLELRYNSNGIEWKQDLFSLWKQFKLVRYHYSIDDIGERNEYIRYPSNWRRMTEVFKILDTETPPNVEVTIACAVQALNVYYIPDFLRWKLEQNFKKINKWPLAAGGINFHFVYHPPHLNVKVLPAKFKQQIREKFEEFYKWWEDNWELGLTEEQKGKVTYEQWRASEYGIKRLEGIIQFMESEDWSNRLPETKEYLELIDKQRNLKFEEVFYEMKGIFDDIN
jgi:hypothetical protein